MFTDTLLQPLETASHTAAVAAVVLVTLSLLFAIAVIALVLNARVKNSRQRIESLLDTTQQGFVLWTPSGRITDTNPAFRALTGLTDSQLRKRTMRDVFDRDISAQFDKFQVEARVRRADGTFVPCLLDCNSLTKQRRRKPLCFALITDISERVRAEESIRLREAQFHALLDATPDPLIIADDKGSITMINRQAEQFFGYTSEELIGQSVDILLPSPLQSSHALQRERYLGAPELRQMGLGNVLYTQTKSGARIPVIVRLSPIQTLSGSWVVGSVRDISEPLAAVNTLRLAVAEQTAIFESASIGIVQLKNRIIERANARCHEMLGYAPGELIGQSTHIWYESQDDYNRIGAEAYPLIWRGETSTAERRLRRKDGRCIWVRTSNRAIDPSDPAQGTVVMLQDVTAEHEAVAAMTLANQEQTAILDTATCGVALVRDRTFVRGNRRLHELFGWEPGDMIGRTTDILHPDAPSVDRATALYETIWRGSHGSLELELIRRDGSRLWARLTGNAIDIDAPDKGTVWIIDDITHEREVTEALQQAKDAAEAATRAKSEFLSNMSHEIRTPMNAIIGMSHLALKTSLTAQQRNYIEKVHRAGTNLLGIINDVLDFSKLEAGKMSMEMTGFRVEDVIDNFSLVVGMKAEEKDLELVVRISDDVPPRVVGDSMRLTQVLINLGSNAAKFTDHGEVVLGIDVVKQHKQNVELHFWVQDSGIGMTPEQSRRLFKSFMQADASTTRKYGGTGLGLAISKDIVELMGGRIWVDSVEGEGSTFHFQVPFAIDEHEAPAPVLTHDDLRGLRTLVVDDNDAAREILVEMTRSFGLDARGVSDAFSALQAISAAQEEGHPYRVLLTDWCMPVLDGVDLIERLGRKHGDLPAVIMVTAFRREDALAKARDRGIDVSNVLIKPVTPSSLLTAIGDSLGAQPSTRVAFDIVDAATQRAMDQLRGARVLLVDDNDMNLELAQELLASAGIEVVCATDGQAAIEVLSADPDFDGVLMDCQMPVMDGYAATRAIRAIEHFRSLPVLAVTGNVMVGDKEKAMKSGMWDQIAKPYDVPTMFATMARWIHPSRPALPAASAVAADPALPPPAAPSAGALLPAHLDGIDLQAGLRTSIANEALYSRLLERFVHVHNNFARTFDQAIDDSDPMSAQRCAHTLRGTAANIGATALALHAGQLEEACRLKAAPEDLRRCLAQTLRALDRVLAGLHAWLSARPLAGTSSANGAPFTLHGADQLADLVGRLRTLLEEGDVRACELWEQELPQFQAAFPQDWKAIHERVSAFAFEEALPILGRRTRKPLSSFPAEAESPRGAVLT